MTPDQLRAWLVSPRVADGAWSSILRQRAGLSARQPAELLNLRSPEVVLALSREYVKAGAEFLSTNTFAATSAALRSRQLDPPLPSAVELCRAGAQLARQAIGGKHEVLIAGVLGASGAILAVQEVSAAELRASYAESAAALAEGGVNLVLLETFSELSELLLAIEACREATKLPIVACLSFDSGPQRTRTIAGLEAADAARPLLDAGATIVGSNCGAGFAAALPALVALHAGSKGPVWLKPSAGVPELADDRIVYTATPEDFARPVRQWIDAGAGVVGGCCGVGPEHVQRIAADLAKLRSGGRGRVRNPAT
ncbi:MAG: homocysteine S-methyltransferase family protein [Phycisphaerae bacterium]|nr:homocysteine S-methyltransferase family protein [Phycisphaerae bacterium]